MGYIERQSCDQMPLLPASVDDYVAADNALRFIAAFVDDLDPGESRGSVDQDKPSLRIFSFSLAAFAKITQRATLSRLWIQTVIANFIVILNDEYNVILFRLDRLL